MSLLEVQHVSKRFSGLKAINDVSFSIRPGEVTFIVGLIDQRCFVFDKAG